MAQRQSIRVYLRNMLSLYSIAIFTTGNVDTEEMAEKFYNTYTTTKELSGEDPTRKRISFHLREKETYYADNMRVYSDRLILEGYNYFAESLGHGLNQYFNSIRILCPSIEPIYLFPFNIIEG